MDHDHILRLFVIVVFLAVLPVGAFYRLRSATEESLDRRQEGLFILTTLRPIAGIFWLATFAWMIEPRWMAWASMPVPLWLRWIAAMGFAAASSLLIWTFQSLGQNLTDTVVTRREHTLVAHGPYRWIRHPLYTTVALMTTSIALIAANWLLLLLGPVVFGLLLIRTRTEEANLVARFGDGYRTYMDRTGRFLPRIGASRHP